MADEKLAKHIKTLLEITTTSQVILRRMLQAAESRSQDYNLEDAGEQIRRARQRLNELLAEED